MDIVNMIFRDEDSIIDQIYKKQIFWLIYYSNLFPEFLLHRSVDPDNIEQPPHLYICCETYYFLKKKVITISSDVTEKSMQLIANIKINQMMLI